MTATETAARTPLVRFVDWYEGLSNELRDHIGAHLFRPGLPHLDTAVEVPRTRRTTMGSRLAMIAKEPEHQAELVAVLAARTDQLFANAVVKELWTGESRVALERGHLDRGMQIVSRSMEWMRAAEHWARLRETGLASRRIERWLAKREHDSI